MQRIPAREFPKSWVFAFRDLIAWPLDGNAVCEAIPRPVCQAHSPFCQLRLVSMDTQPGPERIILIILVLLTNSVNTFSDALSLSVFPSACPSRVGVVTR